MDKNRALTIAIGCVMASELDNETKKEVISKLVEIEDLIEDSDGEWED